jgi:lactoylglutathione lyase
VGRATQVMPMLSATDLGASLRFYRDMLGGAVSYQFPADEGAPAFVSLSFGATELGIGQMSDEPAMHGRPLRPAAGHRIELCIYVADVDETVSSLIAGGAVLVLPPADLPWGERAGYVEDPDGNLVMITAHPS